MKDQQQMHEWKSKANAEYQKVIASLLSLSTATLVVPPLFLKDLMGVKPGISLFESVSCSVAIAWGCLFVCITCCLIFYYASAKWLKQAYGGEVNWTEESIERSLDFTFWIAVISYLIGIFIITFFIVNYIPGKQELIISIC